MYCLFCILRVLTAIRGKTISVIALSIAALFSVAFPLLHATKKRDAIHTLFSDTSYFIFCIIINWVAYFSLRYGGVKDMESLLSLQIILPIFCFALCYYGEILPSIYFKLILISYLNSFVLFLLIDRPYFLSLPTFMVCLLTTVIHQHYLTSFHVFICLKGVKIGSISKKRTDKRESEAVCGELTSFLAADALLRMTLDPRELFVMYRTMLSQNREMEVIQEEDSLAPSRSSSSTSSKGKSKRFRGRGLGNLTNPRAIQGRTKPQLNQGGKFSSHDLLSLASKQRNASSSRGNVENPHKRVQPFSLKHVMAIRKSSPFYQPHFFLDSFLFDSLSSLLVFKNMPSTSQSIRDFSTLLSTILYDISTFLPPIICQTNNVRVSGPGHLFRRVFFLTILDAIKIILVRMNHGDIPFISVHISNQRSGYVTILLSTSSPPSNEKTNGTDMTISLPPHMQAIKEDGSFSTSSSETKTDEGGYRKRKSLNKGGTKVYPIKGSSYLPSSSGDLPIPSNFIRQRKTEMTVDALSRSSSERYCGLELADILLKENCGSSIKISREVEPGCTMFRINLPMQVPYLISGKGKVDLSEQTGSNNFIWMIIEPKKHISNIFAISASVGLNLFSVAQRFLFS